jgi:AcrR family transcriptional regulator
MSELMKTTEEPPPRARQAGGVRRAQVVAALLDLLHELGVEGVTTVAIAKRMGLSQAALFKHFPAKADIWKAAMDAIGERVYPVFAAAAASRGTALQRLQRTLRANLEMVEQIPAMTALLFYREGPQGGGQFREALDSRFRVIQQMIGGLIQEAVAAGEVPADLDVDRATTLCLGLIQGLLHRSHFEPHYHPLEDFDALFGMVIEGIGQKRRH